MEGAFDISDSPTNDVDKQVDAKKIVKLEINDSPHHIIEKKLPRNCRVLDLQSNGPLDLDD